MQRLLIRQAPQRIEEAIHLLFDGRVLPSSTVPLPSEVVPQWCQQVMFAVMKEPGLFVAAQPAGCAAAK